MLGYRLVDYYNGPYLSFNIHGLGHNALLTFVGMDNEVVLMEWSVQAVEVQTEFVCWFYIPYYYVCWDSEFVDKMH